MATLNFTARELRQKQAYILDKADAGEEVIIWRGKNKAYMLTPVHENDQNVSETFKQKIAKAREDYLSGKGVTCRTYEESKALFETL